MIFNFTNNVIAVLITYSNSPKNMEYRLAYLERADIYMGQDLADPLTQAHFVVAFHNAPVYTDYDDALHDAAMIAQERGDNTGVDILNYSQHDFYKFMEYSFAKRLIDSRRRAKVF